MAFIALVRVLLRDLQRLLDHGGAAQAGERADAGDRQRAAGRSPCRCCSESVVVGLVGSVIGLGPRHALLALGLKAAFSALGLDLPSNGLTVLPRTIILTIVVGLLVTVLSALLPALRSGQVPPVAAMRDTALESTSATKGRTISGLPSWS